MKKLLILLFLIPISLSAQEKYFHELKGMEDSTGTTHLFYRMFEEISNDCLESEFNIEVINSYNNVFHFDSNTKVDSIMFQDYYEPSCISYKINAKGVSDYDFYDNDPKKWIIQTKLQGCYPYPINDYLGRTLTLPLVCLVKEQVNVEDYFDNKSGFVLSNKEDSLYYNNTLEGFGFRVAIKDDFSPRLTVTNEEEYGFYNNYMSSVKNIYGVSVIHPKIDSVFYSKNDSGHLLISEKYSSSFTLSDTTSFFNKLAFDANSTTLYAIVSDNQNNKLKSSDDYGKADSWRFLNIPESLNRLQYLETDSSRNGSLFIADSTLIYSSSNYGEAFDPLLEMDYRITGLYKKPNTDILYVLTTDELFEINTSTLEKTSLKKLPVSNEASEEIPSSVTLHQNYPNPFNPTTTISFDLDKPTEVTLTIFNALGRTVAVLVNELKPTGFHQVDLDASNLSSGIYFYRLEAGEFSLTKRLTLIK